MRTPRTDYLASTAKALSGAIPNAWRRWRKQQEFSEFARLYPAEADRIAHDLGLTTKDVIKLSSCGPGDCRLLEGRMQHLGLDPDALARNQPEMMRELVTSCSRCGSKARCAHDLRTDSQSGNWRSYCLNEQVLEALASRRH